MSSPTVMRMLEETRRGNALMGADENGLTTTVIYPGINNWDPPYKFFRDELRWKREEW